MKTALINLSLVECPLTNRECDWMWEDADARDFLSRSKLYCIGQRSEVFFENFNRHDELTLSFDLSGQNGNLIEDVRLDFNQFFSESDLKADYSIESGPKIIRVWKNGELFKWFTVDRLLHHYWHGKISVDGLEDYRKFTDFDLHYVGISNGNDSFSRLFRNGHKKRAKILSQEKQLASDAALTDEIFILFFEARKIGITVISEPDEVPDDIDELLVTLDDSAAIADAEKALIKMLNSEYNEVKYKDYPRGLDGLFNSGLSRYAFFLGDDISLVTYESEIRGLVPHASNLGDGPDVILVEGELARLVRLSNLRN